MVRISIKSNFVLIILASLALIALIIVEKGKTLQKQEWYDDKLEASRLAEKAANTIKNHLLEYGVFIDNVNDPNETALIGQEYTEITTDRGYLDSKLSTTNPNFAAIIVSLLKESGLEKGDNIAVGLTGSFPGMNIALYAAIEQLGLDPVVISSVGASNWGANDPYFTWLDMESLLIMKKVFKTKSAAASFGGGNDIGRGLSPAGREYIREAIERNEVGLIYSEYLRNSIKKRMAVYDSIAVSDIKAYVNVGGGIASLGSSKNGDLIPPGLSVILPDKNYPSKGVVNMMAERNIPVIHLLNVRKILSDHGMPVNPSPMPKVGEGEIFYSLKYNLALTYFVTGVLVLIIAIVIFLDRKNHRLGTLKVNDQEKNEIAEEL